MLHLHQTLQWSCQQIENDTLRQQQRALLQQGQKQWTPQWHQEETTVGLRIMTAGKKRERPKDNGEHTGLSWIKSWEKLITWYVLRRRGCLTVCETLEVQKFKQEIQVSVFRERKIVEDWISLFKKILYRWIGESLRVEKNWRLQH